jgi:hypothetical protein
MFRHCTLNVHPSLFPVQWNSRILLVKLQSRAQSHVSISNVIFSIGLSTHKTVSLFLNDNSLILLNYGLATGFPPTLPSIMSLSRPYTWILSSHTKRQVYLHVLTCNYAYGKCNITYFRRSEASCVCVAQNGDKSNWRFKYGRPPIGAITVLQAFSLRRGRALEQHGDPNMDSE